MRFARAQYGLLIAVALSAATSARSETALVGVASNFAGGVTEIAANFEAKSGRRIKIALGATGKLYAQIRAGAPFDVLLAADQDRPRMLEADGLAVSGTRFTYAVGSLTLWSATPGRITDDPKQLLSSSAVRTVAIASPSLAPYGLAAQQVLQKLGLWRTLQPRIVTGENISQTFALAATGNASVAFVARPLLNGKRGKALGGSRWDVPADMHDPIKQDAALLIHGRNNQTAKAFLAYLQSNAAQSVMKKLGYHVRAD
jgi:molybdate transport system substrate-binding protein